MNEFSPAVIFLGALATLIIFLLGALFFRISKLQRDDGATVRDELRAGREEGRSAAKELREEVSASMLKSNENLVNMLKAQVDLQQAQLKEMSAKMEKLTESNEVAIDRVRKSLDERVKHLQDGNEKKLEEMRKTVDEKLHDTLEKRLGESFKLVSEQLTRVHDGLGEMKTLATGVGDLKKVLTNVKTRGTWAEVQLGALLEQILTSAQYEKNVKVTPGSDELVEFAVKLPGADGDRTSPIWLPIDSKFPIEDYLRLQEATEAGNLDEIKKAEDSLAKAFRSSAKDICGKYINPPHSTDIAIMFLGTEGLYAEALRMPGLSEALQRDFRVIIAGPTTLSAILNSLRMGFQAMAFEQRASEVWKVLGAVKNEFGKFGDVLAKVKKQLDTVNNTIEQTGVRTRAIQKSLRDVEQLPDSETVELLQIAEGPSESEIISEESVDEDAQIS